MFQETTSSMLEVANFETIVRMQRTAKGLEFEKFQNDFARMLQSSDPAAKAKIRALNDSYVAMTRDVNAAVHVDALMSEFSVRFTNEAYIGKYLMPEVQVDKQSNFYGVWNLRDQLNYPDDAIGPRGDVKELSSSVDLSNSYFANEHGLKEYVDLSTIDNADAPLQPLMHATFKVNDAIEFNEEKAIIAVMSATGNYGSNYLSIPVGSEWNSAGGGNPVLNIQNAVASVLPGPGPTRKIGFCSFPVYQALARHPQIRDLHKYTNAGLMPPTYLAQLFDLDALLVGKAWNDSANPNVAISLNRLWPNVFGVVNVMTAPMKDSYSFGSTFRWGPKTSEVYFDRTRGRRGGYVTKTAIAYVPKVTAAYAGYLLTNCLA